ncbi:hypothetical protein ColTof4_13542 [Colletotrichum tofieldiae]|nr:hypothetical protein ColTof3_14493 [Colletotrichum tofieldiae]GKT81119.1 hypothetical protein ColTof4_13542 [Colletotrichum tofieldiae]GKT97377.1 hypothetical protein Ct61P_15227 [Colletotrichum tofieldiae]
MAEQDAPFSTPERPIRAAKPSVKDPGHDSTDGRRHASSEENCPKCEIAPQEMMLAIGERWVGATYVFRKVQKWSHPVAA